MKIGLDLDDVIVDFFHSFVSFYNQRYDKNLRFDDITSYWIWELGIGRNKEEAIQIVNQFYESDFFDKMPLVRGAKEGVERMAKISNPLRIVTSRPLRFREKTNRFLKRYFEDQNLALFYSSGLHEQGRTKAQICRDEGIDLFVEDYLKYAQECALNGTRVLLLDNPWNRKSNGEISGNAHGKIERVYGWQEIIKKMGEYEENGICT